jgi:hypothetical protein
MAGSLWQRLTNRTLRRAGRRPAARLRSTAEHLERREMPAAFTPGNVVIYRVGDGAAGLVNTGAAVFLDEYTTGGTLVQSIALPGNDPIGPNLIASGTATSEGLLTLSPDGNFLGLAGYNRQLGGSGSLAGTGSALVNRTAAIVNAAGTPTFTVLSDFADGNNPRSAVTVDGTTLYVAGGASGVRYVANLADTTSTQLSTTLTNLRQLNIVQGQLYTSTASGSSIRLGTVGVGVPTTSGQTITNLPGFLTSTGSPYGYFFADLSASVPGVDTLYVSDDGAGQGILKYSLVGGSWVSNGNLSTATGARGLTGIVSGGNVTLFATTGGSGAAGGGSLYTVTDSTGYNAAIAGAVTTVATAGLNTSFRGVAFTPGTFAAVNSVTTATPSVITGTPVNFTATFSAAVSGLSGANFTLTTLSGSAAGTVGTPTTSDNIVWTVPVTGVTGTGSFRLDVASGAGVTPILNNVPFTAGAVVSVTPAGATLDVVAGQAIYTASQGKANNVTFGVSGLNYSLTDTAETISLTAAAKAAGWGGDGTNTVTGPDANTDSVAIILGDGSDTITLNDVNDPVTVDGGGNAGDAANLPVTVTLAGALSVTNFETITQSGGAVLDVTTVTLGAGTIGSSGTPIRTTAAAVTALAGDGGLWVTETDGADFTLAATGPGTITVVNQTGTLTVAGASTFGAGAVILSSGDGIAINAALGNTADSSGEVTIAANTDGAGAEGLTVGAAGSVTTKATSATAFVATVNTTGGGTGDAVVGAISVGSTGTLTIDANAGSILFYAGKAAISAGGGVEPPVGEVVLKTSGAASAIGAPGTPVVLATGFISATAGTGGIDLLETAAQPTAIKTATAQGAGAVTISAASASDNGFWIQGPVTTGSGNITVRADDSFLLQFGGSVGGPGFTGKILIDVNLDGGNEQVYLQDASAPVQTLSSAADAVVINVSASTTSGGIGGAVLGNITVGAGGGITVNAGKLLGNSTDANRAGLIGMADAASLLDAGPAGTVTLVAAKNAIGSALAPIRVNAGTVSANTTSTDSVTNPLQEDGDVFVTTLGAAAFSGTTTSKGPRIGDITFATLAGDMTLNGDVAVDNGAINLNTAGKLFQTAGKIVTTGSLAHTAAALAVFDGVGNAAPAFAVPAGLTVLVNGTFASTFTVDGVLGGNGVIIGPVAVNANGTLAPGASPGILSTGDVNFAAPSTFAVELNGPAAGTGYDQLDVTGTVNLGGTTLSGSLGFTPAPGAVFRIIDNDGADPVVGTFNGLAEGATVAIGAVNFTVSYKGGDGNDVTLTAPGSVAPPTVTDFKVNAGGAQRSMVTSLAVTFSEAVTFPSGVNAAFQLNRILPQPTGGPSASAPLGLVNTNAVLAGSTVTITFLAGGAVPVDPAASLIDGNYQLTIVAANVVGAGGNLDGNGNGTGGDDFQSPATGPGRIFRLFGDADGDGDVDAVNFGQFRAAFGAGDPVFDFDGDGDVDAADFGQFRARFGSSV